MVSTASGSASSPPGAVKLDGVPVAHLILAQSIGGEVTNLQPGVLPQKLTERHPAREEKMNHSLRCDGSECFVGHINM